MNNIWKRYKRIILTSAAIGMGIYLVIWLWFIIDGFIPTGNGIEKRDWLAFSGSYLSFLGTIALGALALWQNKKANDVNAKLAALQVATYSSFVDLIKSNQEIRSKDHDNHAFTTNTASVIFLEDSNKIKLSANFPADEHFRYHIDCVFNNNSDFQIAEVQASCSSESVPSTTMDTKEIYVGKNQQFMFRFNLPIALNKEQVTELRVRFINCYGFCTDYTIKVSNNYDANNRSCLNKIDYKLSNATIRNRLKGGQDNV